MRFAPYLLDPTTPPEGKPRRQMTQPDDPPTPIEQRASSLGIRFTRGRQWQPNSHLALEAAEFAAEQAATTGHAFHRRMFRGFFEDLEDIGAVDTVVRLGEEAWISLWIEGLPYAATMEDVRVRLNGTDLPAGFLSVPDEDNRRQVNARLPRGLHESDAQITVVYRETESPAVAVRLLH